jgi:superfamily II RNA helicase
MEAPNLDWQKITSELDREYESSHLRESDLISEVGGNEFFLIEGDSLLLDILKAPYRRIDCDHSGQFLQLLAAIEKFLQQILVAGGKFAIIFFDCNRSLWDPAVQCFRQLLIHHLRNKTELAVYCLPSWIPDVDPRFSQEFMQTLPAFVALSDAEWATTAMKEQIRAFFAFCKQSLHCCFVSSMRLRSGRLIGLVCAPRNLMHQFNWMSFARDQEESPAKSDWTPKSGLKWLDFITSEACASVINTDNEEYKPRAFELCKVMLIHASLISHLPLEQRALNVKVDQGNEIVKCFLEKYFFNLNAVLERYNFHNFTSVDIFDGRLFYSLLVFFANSENLEAKDIIEDAEFTKVSDIWSTIAGPGSPVIPRIDFIHGECAPTVPLVANNQMITCDSVVKNIVLSEPLGAEGREFEAPREIAEFSEVHHWHSDKRLNDTLWTLAKGDDNPKDLSLQTEENRNTQKFYNFVTKYAASLEGNKLYQGTTLILGSKIHEFEQDSNAEKLRKGQLKKEKTQQKTKKQVIIQQNIISKEKKKREEWSKAKVSINNLLQSGYRKNAIKRLRTELESSCPSDVNVEIRLMLLKIHLKRLDDPRNDHKEDDWEIQSRKIEIFQLVHKIIDKRDTASQDGTKPRLTDTMKADLVKALHGIKFYDSAILAAQELNVKAPKVGKDGESSIKFQLEIMGHLLKRKNRANFDYRVGFKPDAWQKELIDIVDINGSALVVAPTSAGKTFISYYAMKRILEATKDGVVVYISPTKALVNQVSAEVYARFRNAQEQLMNGTAIFGTFTRDYRHKPLNCRILVCVPQCFEILLMSPNHSEWVKKIKYVIFDEVHSIAEVGSGEVWEHLFSLIACPFLALSATVQDTSKLRDWLQVKLDQQNLDVQIQGTRVNVQPRAEAKKKKVYLVEYKYRYSDLSRFIYNPEESLKRIHPCSVLSAIVIRATGFPREIMLEPCDLVHLYDAMVRRIHRLPEASEAAVLLCNYQTNEDFAKSRQITRLQVHAWQEKLTQVIVTLAREKNIAWLDKVFASLGTTKPKSQVVNDIFPMLMHLKQHNLLPVIVFSFDKWLCERLAQKTTKILARLARKKKPVATTERKIPVVDPKRKRIDPETARQIEKSMDLSKLHAANSSFVEPGALTNVGLDQGTLTEEENEMIAHGIGIHHAGRSTKYKQIVEFLFRSKAIQVVFATSTLALGVNMPCKSVVFAKDSMFLNSLSYRQMSGRAGRRGYEKRGNVIFMEVNEGKIRRLFNGDLPILETNFPLSVTLVLRAFLLYKDEQTQESALKIKKLFTEPLSESADNRKLQIFFRFSMEYLMEEYLLTQDGKTIGLAGLAAHLWWAEPANLLLVSLVERSVLHNICYNKKLNKEQKKKQLLITLSTIFDPREIHSSMYKHIKENKTASKIVLETPPQSVIDAIAAHNARIIQTFLNTRRSIPPANATEAILPLSKIRHTLKGQAPTTALQRHLHSTRVLTQLRDPFSVLSGASDEFSSVKEICACIPDIDEGMLPVFKYSPGVLLNRYILDFYEHKQLKLLEEVNRLNTGDSYDLTNNFRLLLRAISAILNDITEKKDPLRRLIAELAWEYGSRLQLEGQKRSLFPK